MLPISQQLLADANINLVDFIVQLFAEAIGLAEDQAFFTGSGTGQPKGISQETIANKGIAGNSTTFDDILELIDLTPQRVVQSPKAAFVGHRNLKRMLRKIKDNNNCLLTKHEFYAILIVMNAHKDNLARGVYGNAYVYFKDGKYIKIKDVVANKIKGEILTLNEKSRILEYREIIEWYQLGIIKDKSEWLNIKTEGLGKRNGENSALIRMTLVPSQKVLTNRGWILASQLQKGDRLVTSYKSFLNGEMEQFLYAIAIGDSHFHADRNNSKNTASIILNDSKAPEYVQWKIDKLSRVLSFHKNSLGNVSEWTMDLSLIKNEISEFKTASNRNPLPFLERHFSSLGLAIFIMDDGYLGKDGCYILSIARLGRSEGTMGAVSHFFEKHGYTNTTQKHGRLHFKREISNKIASDICRYVPECMQYKLPQEFRGKYEDFELNYSEQVVPEYIKLVAMTGASNKQMDTNRSKYDLKIYANNNYMVGNHSNGLIVGAVV